MNRSPGIHADGGAGRRLALGLVLLVAGCGREGPPIHPVSGKVLVDGQPSGGAEVTFHSRVVSPPGVPQTVAWTEPDGSFRASTRLAHDGAPAGEYALTVVWRKPTIVQGEEVAGPDILQGKYADPGSSGLSATVRDGPNEWPPFALQAPRP